MKPASEDATAETSALKRGAVPAGSRRSLDDVHSSVRVPHRKAGFLRQWFAFTGPAILVSVGYMDPGNWGTDLAGGAQFKYGLLWVVALASFMAVILQVISARLGVATGRDLAQFFRAGPGGRTGWRWSWPSPPPTSPNPSAALWP